MRIEYLIYLSLAFLLTYIYQHDLLVFPAGLYWKELLISLVFLFSGFILNALAWRSTLRLGGFYISRREAISGIGLSIFGKYIPGKIWVIVGRAAYSARRHGWSLGQVSYLSLQAQFVTLWGGLMLGTVGMLQVGGETIWGWPTMLLFAGLSLVLFVPGVARILKSLAIRVVKKEIRIIELSPVGILRLTPLYLLAWGCWICAFYWLTTAFPGLQSSVVVGLGFALAGALGIVTFFAPGGLGTREAVLVG